LQQTPRVVQVVNCWRCPHLPHQRQVRLKLFIYLRRNTVDRLQFAHLTCRFMNVELCRAVIHSRRQRPSWRVDASHQVTYRPRTGQTKDALPFIRRVLKVELTYWPVASFRVRRYQQDVWYALHLSRMAQACHTRAPA
jgi:hypothetical protein